MSIYYPPTKFVLDVIHPDENDKAGMDFPMFMVGDLPGCNGKVYAQVMGIDRIVYFGGALVTDGNDRPYDPQFRLRQRIMDLELELFRLRAEEDDVFLDEIRAMHDDHTAS